MFSIFIRNVAPSAHHGLHDCFILILIGNCLSQLLVNVELRIYYLKTQTTKFLSFKWDPHPPILYICTLCCVNNNFQEFKNINIWSKMILMGGTCQCPEWAARVRAIVHRTAARWAQSRSVGNIFSCDVTLAMSRRELPRSRATLHTRMTRAQ